MTLAAVTGIPFVRVGAANRGGFPGISALGATTLDAANEAANFIGRVWWTDGGSHTVDTSGSSSIQWRTGTTTFANAGTTVKVGIAAVDTATGPPGRPSNVADVISFDVSGSFTGGGGGITTGAWQTSVPTSGTKTIASGDLVSVSIQMTARAGADSVLVGALANLIGVTTLPLVSTFTGGAYADAGRYPNVVLVASDGTLGYIAGGYVATVASTTNTWNNTSGTKEYGNILRFPFPTRAYGIYGCANLGGDCDFIFYSDPLGTPVAQRTVSVDANTIGSVNNQGEFELYFAAYDLSANTDYAVIAKPTSATNISILYKSYNAAAHQNSEALGTDCYAINRASGAFASQNANKDRFAFGLLIGAFDAGGAGGGIRIAGQGGLAA